MRFRPAFLAVVSAVALLVTACGATTQPTPTTAPVQGPTLPGPHFTVDRKAIDLGRQPFDKGVTAAFKVTNTGTQPLTLQVPPTVRAEEGC